MKEIEVKVKEGRIVAIVGIGTILVGMLLMILYIRHPAEAVLMEIVCCLAAVLMILAGVVLCMNAHNRKFIVENMNLCYVNWCGKRKSFSVDEIGYCKTELTVDGSKDYLKIYNLLGEKLCKLEYHMKDSFVLLQFLADNQVRIESSEKSEKSLHFILETDALCAEEIANKANAFLDKAKILTEEWIKNHKKFGAQWKLGITTYLEDECVSDKQIWEQKDYEADSYHNLPEGFVVVVEGYLMKDGEFVFNKQNKVVGFCVPIIRVTKSLRLGEDLRIRYYKKALMEIEEQLDILTYCLPRNRYHTENITLQHHLKHELKDKIC
ncbi:MAG: hypothetical protein IJO97_06495 [Lachnospiraceae bacterium]|nr:hypothetical protein [Lachnospiraceae bacterium]